MKRKHVFKKKYKKDIRSLAQLIVSIPRNLITVHAESLPVDDHLSMSGLKQLIKVKNILPPGMLVHMNVQCKCAWVIYVCVHVHVYVYVCNMSNFHCMEYKNNDIL